MSDLFHREWNPKASLSLVFIHAFPLTHEMWKVQIPAMPESYRAIAYDLRGLGKSPVGDGQYTMESFVEDLLALLDHLKIDRAVLCGLSIGGYIALRFVEKFPARVEGLVLCNTRSEADNNEGKLKRAQAIRKIKSEGLEAFAKDFVPLLLSDESKNNNPALLRSLFETIHSQDGVGVCGAQLAMLGRTDTTEALPKIKVPTLVVHGEQDGIILPTVAEAMQKKIPNSRLAMIPTAGHLSNLENSEAFNVALLNFVKSLNAYPTKKKRIPTSGS